ncbi:MAG: DNA topoisomerase 4 subunit A [Clostridia bacterium]|nr:DNA topoisomerase 4 subunit A [Clostridia bacterium]
MSKTNTPKENNDNIILKNLNDVLHESMIPYTEHVVMDRALPRVEDGLKPVQRRILFSMLELGLTPDKQYRKSARIVGDCMGKYHPHGDSSVYDAMVRMAQDYSLREPLVDGHGNFGSIDGDSAAAMRYTEAKLTPLALEMLRDLDKNTVHWSLNFDDTIKEPDMLPGRFPNLLVNGATGIAVGVATNIPPHNLAEVIDGVCAYIGNNKISLEQMMKHIKAPDFPTGGTIIAGEGLKEAYKTGKGKITLRAKASVEKDGDKSEIVITEMPYQVNKAMLLQKIAELKEKEKGILSFIGEIRDESDRNGLRAVIKIKKDGNATAILNYLFKNTNLETNFNFNMVAIAGGKPKLLGLLEIVAYYVDYQVSVIVKRTKFELDNAVAREHIVKGLLIAIKNIDEIIALIKKSLSVSEAKQKIMERFALTDVQAQAILDMRIARLVNLEVKKLEEEFRELQIKIKELTSVLNSRDLQNQLIIKELKEIKNNFKTKRKSTLTFQKEEEQQQIFDIVDCNYTEQNHILLSADNRLKRLVIKNNVSAKSTVPPKDIYEINTNVIKANDNENILVFTNKGNCIKLPVKDIAMGQWKSKGDCLHDIVKTISFDEKATKILPILEGEKTIIIYTKLGLAKRTLLEEYLINRSFLQAMSIKENDEVVNVEYENDGQQIVLITKNAYSIKFNKNELPIQKRTSVGIKLIKLQDNDNVVFAGQVQKTGSVTIISKSGFAKKVPIGDYETMTKYRRGLKTINLQNEKDFVAFANYSQQNFDFVLVGNNKYKLFFSDKIRFDNRTSKGKQIEKANFDNIYIILDKSTV